MWYRDYRCKHWTMFRDYQNNIQYGIAEDKTWVEPEPIEWSKTNSEYLASNEEIEKALRKEAKRRGFVEGAKFLGCEGYEKDQEILIDKVYFHPPETGVDWGLYCGDSWIYLRGKWGEVVKNLDEENDVYTVGNGMTWYANGTNNLYVIGFDPYKELTTYFYYKSEKHGANFYELIKEIQTKVGEEWKTFVIYKQLGSGLEFSREKEEFYKKFKRVYV